jgi:hypothetical protein
MKTTTTVEKYTAMGMAALLPGMVHILDMVQREVEGLRRLLAEVQGRNLGGRPRKNAAPDETPKLKLNRGWPDDPEERKAECMRRRRVAAKNRKAKAAQAVAA